MLLLDITFLTGRYVATSEADREVHEWPPHPGRVFSALVATWADDDEPSAAERDALTWLENLGAPELHASAIATEHVRTPVPHFVPINDTSVIGRAETTRRAAKLAAIDFDLSSEQAKQNPSQNRLEKFARDRAKTLDVGAKVNSAGATNPDVAVEMLPDGRPKQARYWPSVFPQNPTVSYQWLHANVDESTIRTLDSIAERLVRLGHSSSLTSARFTGSHNEPDNRSTWNPDPEGNVPLRWVQPGQLDALERGYQQDLASKPRTMPKLGVRYRGPSGEDKSKSVVSVRPSTNGDWLCFAFADGDRRLPARRGVDIANAARGALLHHADNPRLPLLSGHDADGNRLTAAPHIYVVPIPFVAGSAASAPYATGQVMGISIIIPGSSTPSDRAEVLTSIATWRASGFKLQLGRLGALELMTNGGGLGSLQEASWARDSTTWISTTPIAMPRHPGDLSRGSAAALERRWSKAEQIIGDACEHIDLPRPTGISLSRTPLWAGTEDSRKYPAFYQNSREGKPIARALVHAKLEFGESIKGPIIVGSGRFLGLGLMRPVNER